MTEELTCEVMDNGDKTYRDIKGRIVRTEQDDGYWEEYTYGELWDVLLHKTSNGFVCRYTRDKFGNVLTHESSDGFWSKYTRDEKGKELSFENSEGNWSKYTRDAEGNILTFENKRGKQYYLSRDHSYRLIYLNYVYDAGCRHFTYKKAIKHWTQRSKHEDPDIKARAIKFLAAIEKHRQSLSKFHKFKQFISDTFMFELHLFVTFIKNNTKSL